MYTAKVKRLFFTKKYNCKGHVLLEKNKCTMLILEDERRVFVPNNCIIEFSDGWFKTELQKSIEKSNGEAVVDHNLKG